VLALLPSNLDDLGMISYPYVTTFSLSKKPETALRLTLVFQEAAEVVFYCGTRLHRWYSYRLFVTFAQRVNNRFSVCICLDRLSFSLVFSFSCASQNSCHLFDTLALILLPFHASQTAFDTVS